MSEQLRIEGYVEAYVLIDGALEENETFGFGHGRELDEWVKATKWRAMNDPRHTEIFLLNHDHSPDFEDCACAQYLTDHHPFWEHKP